MSDEPDKSSDAVNWDQVGAVILAGGLGTRIRCLVPDLPKPMAPVLGRPFLEWLVRFLARQGIRRIIISTGFLSDKIEAHFQSAPVESIDVRCIREPEPYGTAGGFYHAIRASQENPKAWMVFNGDSLALNDLNEMLQLLNDSSVVGIILAIELQDASRYGRIICDSEGWIRGFEEKSPGHGIVNAGVYLFRPSVLDSFPGRLSLSFENDVFPLLCSKKSRLKASVSKAPFLDIGTPESYGLAERFIRQNMKFFA